MALQKRTAAAPPPVASAPVTNWLSLDFYSGGGSFALPEGDYTIEDVTMRLFTPTDKLNNPRGEERLVGEVKFKNDVEGAEEHEPARFGLGSKAKLSFMPSADGSTIVPIPGGAGDLNNKTNWFIFIKSLYDCGMPEDFLSGGSVKVLIGLKVHLTDIPEPEERKGFASTAATGDVQQPQQNQTPRRINIVSVINNPEFFGGDAAEAAPAKPATKPNGKAATAKQAQLPLTAPVAETAEDDEEHTLALSTLSSILGDNPKGLARIKLKVDAKAILVAEYDAASSQHIIDTWFGVDAKLKSLLAEVGYQLAGPQIKPL